MITLTKKQRHSEHSEESSRHRQNPSALLCATASLLERSPQDDTISNGFTLIELAIALMVIGLLIGGVLKGQELIENAKITATIRDIKAFDTAAMIFRNSYGALPGDIRNPQARLPNCTTAVCNWAGNGDGLINSNFPIHEIYSFFVHLDRANLISSSLTGEMPTSLDEVDSIFLPTHLGSYYAVGTLGARSDHQNAYLLTTPEAGPSDTPWPTSKVVATLDSKLDDGKPDSGSVKAGCDDGSTDWVTEDSTEYQQNVVCMPYIYAGF